MCSSDLTTALTTLSEGMHNLYIPNSVSNITFSVTGDITGTLIVDKIRLIKGFNPYLGIDELSEKYSQTSDVIEGKIINKLKDYARSLRESNNYQHQSQNYQAEELIVPTDGSIEEYMPFN